jgi:prolyl 4-hydroxylase
MNRFEISGKSTSPHFIGGWMMEPSDICDDLVRFFEAHPEAQKTGQTAKGLNVDAKKTVDMVIFPNDLKRNDYDVFNIYIKELFACYKDYVEQWPFLGRNMPNVEIGAFNLQRYLPGDHFQQVHSERTNLNNLHRLFAWMTYLNDVEDCGTTSFAHYDIEVKPQKGKTLIWPAEWTHAHAGNLVTKGVKYIITGWIHFPESH